MEISSDIVLVLGSGPNVRAATDWPRQNVDRIVVINNAWQVRSDWDDLIFPEDFAPDRRPPTSTDTQRFIEADQFVPAQNQYGGFVYAGGTMAFTAAYWALSALKPKVLAFLGCDMVYSTSGQTHFYGTGTADPLRDDVTLRDLGAKSARLGLIALSQGCRCVNLSQDPSQLLFDRAALDDLRRLAENTPQHNVEEIEALRATEGRLGYFVASGRYWEDADSFDAEALADIDHAWRALWAQRGQ